jgi:pyruvyltransferase
MKVGLSEDVPVSLRGEIEQINDFDETTQKIDFLSKPIFLPDLQALSKEKKRALGEKLLIKGKKGLYLPIYCSPNQSSEDIGTLVLPYLLKKCLGQELEKVTERPSRKAHFLLGDNAFRDPSPESIIWGAGLLEFNQKERDKKAPLPKKILSVKGPLTRDHLLNQSVACPEIYGDPALLLPRFYQPKVEKKYSVGIVAHHLDYDKIKRIYRGTDVHVISPLTKDIERVIDEINKCEKILSSSLHGIVIAHAYEIPATLVTFSQKKGHENKFKYKDYFSSLGMPRFESLYLEATKEPYSSSHLSKLVSWNPQPKFPIDTDDFYNSCPFIPNGSGIQGINPSLKSLTPLLLTLASSKELSVLVTKEILPFINDVNIAEYDSKCLIIKNLKDRKINLVSAEGFFENKNQVISKLKKLKAATKSSQSKIVLAVQNQSDLVFRAFRALKSEKEQRSFYREIKDKKILDYSLFLKCLRSVFTGKKVHFFILEKFIDDPELAISKLIDFVNPREHDASLKRIKKANFNNLPKIFKSLTYPKSNLPANHELNIALKEAYGKANDNFSQENALNLQVYNYPSATKKTSDVQSGEKLKREALPHEDLSFLNASFEKIYLINRDSSKDRLASFKAHVEDLGGLEFERFSAVEGSEVTHSANFNFPSEKSTDSLACLLSHYKTIEKAFLSGCKSALILEDNARFSPQLRENLKKSLKELPEDWDLLHLGGLRYKIFGKKCDAKVFKGAGFGKFAYAFSRKGLEKVYTILKDKIENSRPLLADGAEIFNASHHYLNTYRVYPWVVHYTSEHGVHRNTETSNVSYFYKNEEELTQEFNREKIRVNLEALNKLGVFPFPLTSPPKKTRK